MASVVGTDGCNIGPAERRTRYVSGWLGLFAGAGVVAAVVVLDWPRAVVLAAAIPFFVGLLGLLQARRGVCVGYAVLGRENLDRRPGDATPVDDSERLREARRAARGLVLRAAAGAVLATGLAVLVVSLVAPAG